jgi:DNA polymerase-3 subunit alpha
LPVVKPSQQTTSPPPPSDAKIRQEDFSPMKNWADVMNEFSKINPAVNGALAGSKAFINNKANVVLIKAENPFFMILFKNNPDNKKALENLIKSGAFDGLGLNRRQMLDSYEMLLEMAGKGSRGVIEGQMNLFDTADSADTNIKIPYRPEFDKKRLYAMEKEAAGIYLTGEPLGDYEYLGRLMRVRNLGELSYENTKDEQEVKLLCVIGEKKLYDTKKGSKMAFLTLEDKTGEIDAVVFPDLFLLTASKLNTDAILMINGKISKKDDSVSVICGSIAGEDEFSHLTEHMQLCVKTPSDKVPVEFLERLSQRYKGNTQVCFFLTDTKKMVRPRNKISLCINIESYNELLENIKSENIGLI